MSPLRHLKKMQFFVTFRGVGNMEDAAHLHLIPKPTEPWSCLAHPHQDLHQVPVTVP